jgi:hypothetical protein
MPFSAVPVLPAIGIGKPLKTGVDVPPFALAPYPSFRYVVVVTAEHGGFGADTAAPEARKILATLFGVKDKGPAPDPNGSAGIAKPTAPIVPAGATG